MWIRAFYFCSTLFNVGLAITVGYLLWTRSPIVAAEHQSIEYKDFVSILLTALAVMVAVVTLLVAALAIWGFGAIREDVRGRAAREARREANRIAKDVAGAVAARTVRETLPVGTTGPEAGEIAKAMDGPNDDGNA